jgi:hypothetical protein
MHVTYFSRSWNSLTRRGLLDSNSSMQIVFQYKDVLMSEYLPE